MATYEGLRLKVQKKIRTNHFLVEKRKKLLNEENFTIISNNCWGGMIYESYNIPKESPTVGMFFMADDYIKFLTHLKEYIAAPLCFIQPGDSRWKNEDATKGDKRFGSYPVGKLEISIGGQKESIEIFFLHYHSAQEVKDKWERRIKRINWDKLFVKFNDQNGCTEEHIKAFDELPYKNKVCFTVKAYPKYKSVIRIKSPKSHEFIRASYEPFGKTRYMDMAKLLNSL